MSEKLVAELTDGEIRVQYRATDHEIKALFELSKIAPLDRKMLRVIAAYNDRRHALGREMIRRRISP